MSQSAKITFKFFPILSCQCNLFSFSYRTTVAQTKSYIVTSELISFHWCNLTFRIKPRSFNWFLSDCLFYPYSGKWIINYLYSLKANYFAWKVVIIILVKHFYVHPLLMLTSPTPTQLSVIILPLPLPRFSSPQLELNFKE